MYNEFVCPHVCMVSVSSPLCECMLHLFDEGEGCVIRGKSSVLMPFLVWIMMEFNKLIHLTLICASV